MLAHDSEDAASREPLTLEEGLDHFAGEAYADVELDVDLKLPGYEREVVDGLAERGLIERSLVSLEVPREPGAPRRAGARRAPRLVGAERAARLHPLAARAGRRTASRA